MRTDFGLGGEGIASIKQTRNWALEYRRLAKPGLNPCFNAKGDMPIFEEFAEQVHIDWMLTWKSDSREQQWINTFATRLVQTTRKDRGTLAQKTSGGGLKTG